MPRLLISLVLAFLVVATAERPDAQRAAAPAGSGRNFWPTWRGPYNTGVSTTAQPPTEWSETKNVRWKIELPGRGAASPIVWGDRVYVLTAVPADRAAGARERRCAGLDVLADDSRAAGARRRPSNHAHDAAAEGRAARGRRGAGRDARLRAPVRSRHGRARDGGRRDGRPDAPRRLTPALQVWRFLPMEKPAPGRELTAIISRPTSWRTGRRWPPPLRSGTTTGRRKERHGMPLSGDTPPPHVRRSPFRSPDAARARGGTGSIERARSCRSGAQAAAPLRPISASRVAAS